MEEDGPGSTQGGGGAIDVAMTTEDEADTVVSKEEASHPQHPPSPPRLNETICLRILSHLDTSEDLYSAALTNRTFYTALKNNELTLMRHLVRTHRRLILHVLGGERRSSPAAFADPSIAARTWVQGQDVARFRPGGTITKPSFAIVVDDSVTGHFERRLQNA